ncbi:MAG: DUF6465 family protein [Lachnospiraceae bacterium]
MTEIKKATAVTPKAVAKPIAKVAPAKTETAKVTTDTTKKDEVKAAEVKPAAAKPVAAKPAAEKKAPAKSAEKKAPAKKAPAKSAEKKAPAKKEAVKEAVTLQFAGKSYSTEELVKIAKDVWKYDLKQKVSDFKSVELFVKPEESVCYYIINGDVTGNFGI